MQHWPFKVCTHVLLSSGSMMTMMLLKILLWLLSLILLRLSLLPTSTHLKWLFGVLVFWLIYSFHFCIICDCLFFLTVLSLLYNLTNQLSPTKSFLIVIVQKTATISTYKCHTNSNYPCLFIFLYTPKIEVE